MTSRLTKEGEMRCLFAGGRLCNQGVRRPAGESDDSNSDTRFIVLQPCGPGQVTPLLGLNVLIFTGG